MTSRWWQFWIFNPYGTFNTKRQGKIDGKLAIPSWGSEQQPDFLRELYHLTQTTMQSIVEKWHRLDRDLKRTWVTAVLRRQQAEKELVEARDREEQAQQRYQEVHGRRLAVSESPTRTRNFLYWVVAALALVGEFPFNTIVFQQLGSSLYETWIVTAFMSFSLVLGAHFLGKQLHEPVAGRPKAIISRILLAALPFLTILFVAMLRRDHMRQVSQTDPLELLGVNLVINLLAFWLLTYYSYNVHDPVEKAVLSALSQRLSKEHALHAAEKAEAEAQIDRQKAHRQALQDATGWVSEVRRRAALYRRTHLRARNDRDQHGTPVPEWFNREPELSIPEDLKELEWNVDSTVHSDHEIAPPMSFHATKGRQ